MLHIFVLSVLNNYYHIDGKSSVWPFPGLAETGIVTILEIVTNHKSQRNPAYQMSRQPHARFLLEAILMKLSF